MHREVAYRHLPPAAGFDTGGFHGPAQLAPAEFAEVLAWYRLTVGQGLVAAQFSLDVQSRLGRGGAHAFIEAAYSLGMVHQLGEGVDRDYAEAAYWYGVAAEQGLAAAQSNLGLMYWLGQGVPRDLIAAFKWLSLAAADGNRDAIRNRDAVAELLTPAQFAEAQRLWREWHPRR